MKNKISMYLKDAFLYTIYLFGTALGAFFISINVKKREKNLPSKSETEHKHNRQRMNFCMVRTNFIISTIGEIYES
jgi:hypothetical protein